MHACLRDIAGTPGLRVMDLQLRTESGEMFDADVEGIVSKNVI